MSLRIGKIFLACWLVWSTASAAHSQDYVGVLPEMLKPEVSEKLGLSDDQKEKLQALMRTRMSAAIGLSQALREAPIDQHDQLRADFNSESERLAFGLLDPEQQKVLAKYRVGWLGMLSLADEEVAQSLNLAEWQRETVAEWVKRVRANRRGTEAARTRTEAEREIRQAISESQWGAWQVLAGQIDSSPAGPPAPPERTSPEPQPATVAQVAGVPREADGGPAEAADGATEEIAVEDITVEMNFQGQPWKDVIQWLAEQADLSLQSDVPLPGSFTYRDRSRKYTIPEAMDIMNATLLNSGYTMFRQGRMLRVIDFEKDQEKSGELLQELADFVDEDELARRGQYEPVKFMFSLERLDPDTIKNEAEQLRSIYGTVRSLPSSRQLLVTDMAANVRGIAEMIRRAESSGASTVKIFTLKAITAEEVLSVARPLLGLEEDANTSDDIKISTNAFGSTIFASGEPDKIQILKDLVEQMDVPPAESETTIGQVEKLELLKHKVVGIDMQLAYEVVSQLLAGSPDVKLAQDAVAKQLVLQARPSEHKLVRETLAELAGDSSDFVVIQLKRLDPTMAIAAIKKFFNLPDTPAADSPGPVIDGDLLARQVWVKGSSTEVEQIRQLVAKLEENATSTNPYGDNIRMIPMTGSSAQQLLQQMEQLWGVHNGGANPMRVLTPSSPAARSSTNSLPQRTFSGAALQRMIPPGNNAPLPPRTTQPATVTEPNSDEAAQDAPPPKSTSTPAQSQLPPASPVPSGRLTAFPQQESSASDAQAAAGSLDSLRERMQSGEIVIMQGPNGLIIQCEDEQVLAEFEGLLRLLADQAALGGSEPTIVYLKYRKADATKELLEAILSGTTSSSGSSGGLLGDMASSVLGGFGGGMFGSMLGGGAITGTSTTGIATGDVTIIADPWMNSLVIKASPVDMRLIEQLLEVIDQPEGPLPIETQGQLELIPVISQDVTQMLNLVKQLYGDRIEGNSSRSSGGGGGGGGDRGGQPNPAEFIAALRGASGGSSRGGANSKLVEPKISIGADTNTNSLIVIAQPKQIAEIRQLVETLDTAGEAEKEDLAFESLEGVVSGELFKSSVARILGPKAVTNTSPSPTSNNSGSGGGSSGGGDGGDDDAASQARRAAFAEMMRSRFGGGDSGRSGGDSGRGSGGSPFGGGGGSPFGGGGSPFGGGGFFGRGGGPGGGGDSGRRGGN